MPRHDMTLARYREARALELALGGGTWADIAKELGYQGASGAWKAAQRGLRKRTSAAADRYWGRQMLDLDLVQERVWPAAMRGDVQASVVAVRAIEQRCRLLEIGSSGQGAT